MGERRKEEEENPGEKKRIRREGGGGRAGDPRCLGLPEGKQERGKPVWKSWMSFRVQHKPKIVEPSVKCTRMYLQSTSQRLLLAQRLSRANVPAGTGSTLFHGHGTLDEGKRYDSILLILDRLSDFKPHR